MQKKVYSDCACLWVYLLRRAPKTLSSGNYWLHLTARLGTVQKQVVK